MLNTICLGSRSESFTKSRLMLSAALMLTCTNLLLAESPQAVVQSRLIPPHIVRFEVVLGRLQLSPEYFRLGAAHEHQTLVDGRERVRSISVSVLRGKPTLQFRDHGGCEEIHLNFKADHQVELRFSSGCDGQLQTLTYLQPAVGPIAIRVEFSDGRAPLQFEARSLWNLAIDEKEFVANYLEPPLRRLEPDWHFALTASEVQNLLNNTVHQSEPQAVQRAIARLDSPVAAERHSATLMLDALGLAADYPLRASLAADLSNQQRTAIHKLLDSIQPVGNDSAMRIAVWLSGDRLSQKN